MTRSERLGYLIGVLLEETGIGASIPDEISGRCALLRALMNVRPPMPASRRFIAEQDAELQEQLEAKGIIGVDEIPATAADARLRLWQGDITRLRADAIVNAANSQMLGCFAPLHSCIDNAIHSAAGVQLRIECHRLMQAQGHDEPAGGAKMTAGYNLPARHVIHTVGPRVTGIRPTLSQERELARCYSSCLALADASNLASVAFCCISTGEFRFPARLAATIAVDTVTAYLNKENKNIKTVIFNVFSDRDNSIYGELLR